MTEPGTVIVLNGTPRSGKSSIAREIQESFSGTWINLGVDSSRLSTPPHAQPGIGLRPGEPSHPAAPFVAVLYSALWESIAAHARLGLNVVADLGLYDRTIAEDATRRLAGLRVLFVGARCPVEVVLERRRASPDGYATDREPAERWEKHVHALWTYTLEVDTSRMTAAECAADIRKALETAPSATFLG
jgi:chloramphenicol 3-O phosphotransferase